MIKTLRHFIPHKNIEELLFNQIKDSTLLSFDRIKNLMLLCDYCNKNKIEGDFVECGTYKGGSAAVLSKYLAESRHLRLYDSFEGMPETTEKDGEAAKEWIGECVGSIEDVKEVMNLVSTPEIEYTIKKGWFEQTFQDQLPCKVAFLHCDTDWYKSVLLVLRTFYPLVSEGGVIVLDDFGYWEGCREAFYNFCKEYNEKPLLERIGNSQAY